MSDAKKCDRCGRFFERDEQSCEMRITQDLLDFRHKHYDLCPDCMSKLERWLSNEVDR